MTEPLNVAGCGECFETFVEPSVEVYDNYGVVEEVQVHQEAEGHRNDITFGTIE